MINSNIKTVGFFSYTDMKTVTSPYSCLFISPSFFLISGTSPPSRHWWSPLSILIAALVHAKQPLPPCLHPSSFQTLDLSPLSALVPLPMSFHPFCPSIPLCLLYLTLPASPLFLLLCPSFLSLPDIMSSHYLHSSCCSSPSIYPLSLPSPPLRLSPPDRVTYYLRHSIHTYAHTQPSTRSDLHPHPAIFCLNSQQCNKDETV